MNHVGVASWFKSLHNVQAEFVAKEWIVWIDIEGVPLHAWSRATFAKIGSKWGEMMDLEDGSDDLFAQHSFDDGSTKGEADNVVKGSGLHNDDEESDTEAVSDTYFGDNVVNVDNAEVLGQEKDFGNPTVNVEVSSDPFNIYDYKNLNKNNIEDMYLLCINGKVGVESYQQKVNLTAPTITFCGFEKHKMFSIIFELVYGIIYKNSKKEKRVMRHQ
nr:RNA-directed DNA polymerase, eukaryota [Tanacetum cinerariifolium]